MFNKKVSSKRQWKKSRLLALKLQYVITKEPNPQNRILGQCALFLSVCVQRLVNGNLISGRNPWTYNSRGVEHHHPRFDLVSFQSVLSFEPTFMSKSRDANHAGVLCLNPAISVTLYGFTQ